ncbi:TIGR04282 family arsenosugar biosynthesis glycosyltransferase [Pedobacter glucosidilyticus]|uniref:TIGR04282 family arsenosugar biosynthesis glycosyltransferase n=1 Tax=Pedobacter glucosidilyticus TaxID=1122941 RepID=UPI0026F163A8|nr:DUF2064 domain-containing protein [Pedobacter glucosidilyticus]
MHKTAIILFAELPDIEARKKQFSHLSSFLASKKISAALTKHTLSLVSRCKRDFYWIDSLKQHGDSFGEKITNAFHDIFSKGYQHIICIGNDTLQLDDQHLSVAIDAVERQQVILGPSKDGGTYLIGLSKNNFNPILFKSIKWQSSHTYKNLKEVFADVELVETALLEDFDHFSMLKKLPKSSILSFIKALIIAFKNNFATFVWLHDETFLYRYKALRAPPAIA